jgi:hypothetical protein
MMKRTLDKEYLNSRLIYDDAGFLVWKPVDATTRIQKTWNGRYAGKIAGFNTASLNRVTRNVLVDSVSIPLSRAIWIMHNGEIPQKHDIDHINGNTLDNRIENLRPSTRSQNCFNRTYRGDNALKLKGVAWHRHSKVYVAVISTGGKTLNIGGFKTNGEAALAYAKASIRFHGKFSPFLRNAANQP